MRKRRHGVDWLAHLGPVRIGEVLGMRPAARGSRRGWARTGLARTRLAHTRPALEPYSLS
jgi:hypothetical protein